MRQVNLTFQDKTLEDIKTIAEMEGLPYTVMMRNWIIRRAREYAFTTAAKPAAAAVINASHKEALA